MSPRRPGRTLTTHFASLRVWNLRLTKSDVIERGARVTDKRVYVPSIGRIFDRETLQDVSGKQARLARRVDLLSWGLGKPSVEAEHARLIKLAGEPRIGAAAWAQIITPHTSTFKAPDRSSPAEEFRTGWQGKTASNAVRAAIEQIEASNQAGSLDLMSLLREAERIVDGEEKLPREELLTALRELLEAVEADGRTKRGDYYHQRKAARAVLAKGKP